MGRKKQASRRFAAKLLFQWRPVRAGVSRKRRVCEERIVVFSARSPKQALQKAKRIGFAGEFDHPAYSRKEGHVYFEFIGVLGLMSHILEDEEVWHEFREMLAPMERSRKLLPTDEELLAYGERRHSKSKLKVW